ncbi:MAG: Gfo/Idh/MocA family oxidoreductase [Verrucomicrobiota bacterium]
MAFCIDWKRSKRLLRGAIIGFGEVARHGHWPAYASCRDVEIVGIVDPTAERRNLARELLPAVGIFSTIAELAAETKIDFVDICTPPTFHAKPTLDALAAGWHVLCEKPLVLDLSELEQIRMAAREQKRAVVPVHNWKYAPLVRQATALVRSGAIGPLRAVEIETLRVQDCAAADPQRPNWRRDATIAGGGILLDHGWHAVYLAQNWFREEPVAVRATLHRARPEEAEDEATLTLDFPSGPAKIFLTWKADTRRNTMRLVGDRREIVIDDDTLRVNGEPVAVESALSAGSHHADWFEAMLPDVLASFQQPARALESFNEAAICLSVIRQAYQLAS